METIGEDSQKSPVRPVVVVPTYNNARTLLNILMRIEALEPSLPVLVVNDGSTDATPNVLRQWLAQDQTAPVHVEVHPVNRGKAAALRTAFSAAERLGFTHAITIDSDGQLDPEQIPAFLAAARANPRALILGVRDEHKADYPARSRIGRRISNTMIRLESGQRVSDSQCGLRVYPLDFMRSVPCRANRFGFEAEIITRAGWTGCPIVESPANCKYLPPGERVSHFRPWVDTLRGFRMHLWLLMRAMSPWPHPRWAPAVVPPLDGKKLTHLQRLLHWISPRQAWRQMRDEPGGITAFAAALAVGVMIANLPVYPFQTLLSLYAARRLHLHPLPVIAGSNVSIPPIGFAMIAAAIGTGHFLLHGHLPHWADYNFAHMGLTILLEWCLGSVVVGLAMSIAAFCVSAILLGLLKRSRGQAAPVKPADQAPLPASEG